LPGAAGGRRSSFRDENGYKFASYLRIEEREVEAGGLNSRELSIDAPAMKRQASLGRPLATRDTRAESNDEED
jgi:hypothetical protein